MLVVGNLSNLMNRRWFERTQRYGSVFVVYLLATLFTAPHFMADTVWYADAILSNDKSRIWEFGHLLWRPLGSAVFTAFSPLTQLVMGTDPRANVVFVLVMLGWLSGLMSALLLYAFVRRICQREWIAVVVTSGFIFSHGFLNFSQAGCSYIPGLSFLLLGLYILARDGEAPSRSLRTGAAAGLALAVCVCFWFLYVWSVPAALVSPLFLYGFNRQRWRLSLQAALFCALFVTLIYAASAIHIGIYTVSDFHQWVTEASHGATTRGFSRMIFGFARSFINMGNDGMVFKRFLSHDPFNPVSLAEIFRFSLWKLAFFYIFLSAIAVNLLRSPQGKRVFGLLILNGVPVIAFAILWQGGDIERYLALYPLIFFSLAYSLQSDKALPWLKYVALLFVAAAAVTSISVMANPVLYRQEAAVMERIKDLQPQLKPESIIVTIHQQDGLWRANYSFPFNLFFRRNPGLTYAAVSLGTKHVLHWRQEFAANVNSVWRKGGDVWISKRLFYPRPQPEWNWVEGSTSMRWAELHAFFIQLEVGNSAGGEDGFLLLLRSPQNEQILRSVAQEKQVETR